MVQSLTSYCRSCEVDLSFMVITTRLDLLGVTSALGIAHRDGSSNPREVARKQKLEMHDDPAYLQRPR